MGYSDEIFKNGVAVDQLTYFSHKMPLVGTCDACGETISIYVEGADPMLLFGCEFEHAQACKTECPGKFQCVGTRAEPDERRARFVDATERVFDEHSSLFKKLSE